MRQINKNTEPRALVKWKKANPAATFETLGNEDCHALKQQLKASLLSEQYFLCCYCENVIDPSNSHIEHLRPQKKYPQDQLSYSNLMASCEADGRSSHCGHKKASQLLSITPLDSDDPAPSFVYAADGNIYPEPKDNLSASRTISILGLDAKRLINMRRAEISAVIFELDSRPKEEHAQIAAKLSPDSNNKMPAFISALLYQLRASA